MQQGGGVGTVWALVHLGSGGPRPTLPVASCPSFPRPLTVILPLHLKRRPRLIFIPMKINQKHLNTIQDPSLAYTRK